MPSHSVSNTTGDSISGGGVLVASLGLFVGIVVGVVVLTAALAFTLIYCCCKRNKRVGGGREAGDKMADTSHHACAEPSGEWRYEHPEKFPFIPI